MRIRVTGYTLLQTNMISQQRTKIDVPMLLVEGLRALGHEVTWAPADLVPDEGLRFDAQIVCLAPCMSINTPYALQGLYALAQDIPTLLYWDDWQVRTTISHHRGFAKRGLLQTEKLMSGSYLYPAAPHPVPGDVIEEICRVGRAVCGDEEAPYNWVGHIFPMYRWGNPRLPLSMIPTNFNGELLPVCQLDPSGVIDYVPIAQLVGHQHEKDESWFLASLSPQKWWVDETVKPTWPVRYVGSKKLIQEGFATERLPSERAVQFATARHAGILAPTYPHVGSGWWRSRFLYAARARSVLHCDLLDATGLGSDYHLTVQDVEAASHAQRGAMAEAQAEAVLSRCGTPETFTAELEAIVARLSA